MQCHLEENKETYKNLLKIWGGTTRYLNLGGVFTAIANNRQFVQMRTKDMPRSLEVGDIDVAIGGMDGLMEGRARGMYSPIGSLVIGSMGCRLSLISKPDVSLDGPLKVYSSYPTLAQNLLVERDYDIAYIEERGGKLEGFPGGRNCNAIVDIVETGQTIQTNNVIERDILLDDIPLAVMFRGQPVPAYVRDFAPWRVQYASKTLSDRKEQLDAGTQVDISRKNTLLLLSDQNKLIKAFGEEQAEFVAAISSGENVIGEANDVLWVLETAVLRSGKSLEELWAEYCLRNTKPSRSIKE